MSATIIEADDVDDFDFPQPTAPDAMELVLTDEGPSNIGAVAEVDERVSKQRHAPTQQMPQAPPGMQCIEDATPFKSWQVVYPIYIDAGRAYDKGRRIPKEKAVKNPIAKDMAEACRTLGVSCAFEPAKSHPRDWGNPGRVRVQFKKDGRLAHPTLKTKKELLIAIADTLPKVKAVTKSGILPEYSPLISSGILNKDPAGGPAIEGSSGGAPPKKKKDKKKK